MSLDHGLLNVPLSMRGDLARQASASVRSEAALFEARIREARRAGREQYAKARALIEAVPNARMAELGRPHGLTARAARKQFLSAARSNPALLLATFSKETST